MIIPEILFYLLVALIVYPYVIYPLILVVLTHVSDSGIVQEVKTSYKISIVIAVYNAAKLIKNKIDEIESLDYPRENIEIILISDGSTDNPEKEIEASKHSNLKYYALPTRSGKAIALNLGVSHAQNDILVFFDMRQTYDKNILKVLTSYFVNDSVAGVTGDIIYQGISGSDTYWKLEKLIRRKEGIWKSTVNVSGANYCVRKKDYQPFPPGIILDDLIQPLLISSRGKRILFDSNAIAFDENYQSSEREERSKKTRTLAGNFQILFEYPNFLNPVSNRAWFQYYSHKVSRLPVPLFMCLLFLDTLILIDHSLIFFILFIIQVFIYGMYIFRESFPCRLTSLRVLEIPFLFLRLNEYVLRGLIQYLKSKKAHLW